MKFATKIYTGIIATILASFMISLNAAAWGPERPTYTNANPADWATFNSITDNAAVGDERNFVRIRDLSTEDKYTDNLKIKPGGEYEVYIYYHNDAAESTNATGYGIATDTRVYASFPAYIKKGETGEIYGAISWNYVDTSDKTYDAKVWDEAYITTDADEVVLKYQPGSAVIHNSGQANGSVLSSDMFTDLGTLIGYNQLGGVMPGCAQFSGYITYTLVAESVSANLSKQVSLDGEKWASEVTAEPGQYVTYKINFENTGNTVLSNVIFKDSHDKNMILKSGTTRVFDADRPAGEVIDDIIDISGYNVGEVYPGASVAIIYQAKVDEKYNTCSKFKNVMTVTYNSGVASEADAGVTVACSKDEEPEEIVPPSDPSGGPSREELPDEIVNTGPLEIVMAVIIILAILGTGFYFWRTKHILRTVETEVKGKK